MFFVYRPEYICKPLAAGESYKANFKWTFSFFSNSGSASLYSKVPAIFCVRYSCVYDCSNASIKRSTAPCATTFWETFAQPMLQVFCSAHWLSLQQKITTSFRSNNSSARSIPASISLLLAIIPLTSGFWCKSSYAAWNARSLLSTIFV